MRLSAAAKELGPSPSLRTYYTVVKETGEMLGLPAFRIRSQWYVCRHQLDKIVAEGVKRQTPRLRALSAPSRRSSFSPGG